jgi:hypothetical protein
MNLSPAAPDRTGEGNLFDRRPERRSALIDLLRLLDRSGYRFVTATPGTHARVLARDSRRTANGVRDVLGWSLPFTPDILEAEILGLLQNAGAVSPRGEGLLGADVRVSTVAGTLFLHSAYPTLAPDSVFLGPDSYRFADLIVARMGSLPPAARILDYAAGAGVGGIVAARQQPQSELVLVDINPKASFLSSINAEFAQVKYKTAHAEAPHQVEGYFDLIVTHPPFMMDDRKRAYRDGGDLYGARLSLDWVLDGIGKLKPGGKLVLHTGISIVNGRDVLIEQIEQKVRGAEWTIDYHELDPDIFSEDLDELPYVRHDVERIAAVGLCITRGAKT